LKEVRKKEEGRRKKEEGRRKKEEIKTNYLFDLFRFTFSLPY
jgi:hypothetical protein